MIVWIMITGMDEVQDAQCSAKLGPMQTLGKRASWRKGLFLLINSLLCDRVVRVVTFTDSLL